MRNILSASALAIIAATGAQAITVTTFDDRATFESALVFFVSETFDGGPPFPLVTVTGGSVSFANDLLEDRINDDAAVSTTFDFAIDIAAFGGDFDLAGPGGVGSGISFAVSDGVTTEAVASLPGTAQGFFGFIVDGPETFSQVLLSELDPAAGIETYSLDDLTYGSGTPPPIPVPAAMPLMLAGLAGFGLLARRRRRD
jgi:hypothetical protein